MPGASSRDRTCFPDRWRSLNHNLWKSHLTIIPKGSRSQNCRDDCIYLYILLGGQGLKMSSIYHGYRWEQPDTCVTPLPFLDQFQFHCMLRHRKARFGSNTREGCRFRKLATPNTPGKLEKKNLPKTVHREANAMLNITVFSDSRSMFLFGSVWICKLNIPMMDDNYSPRLLFKLRELPIDMRKFVTSQSSVNNHFDVIRVAFSKMFYFAKVTGTWMKRYHMGLALTHVL